DQLEDEVPEIRTKESQDEFEILSEQLINSLIATRLLVLQVMRNQHNIDCFKWHCVQRSRCSQQLFAKLFHQLLSYSAPVVFWMFQQLKREFDGHVIFDASQHLLATLDGDYRSSNVDQ
ncbi:hypothetical protein BJ741DRAFT_514362, partial [Chytriomyces cf. hyalinus JEL632]